MHTTAGYLLGANLTFHYAFDHKPEDTFGTADIGWITGIATSCMDHFQMEQLL